MFKKLAAITLSYESYTFKPNDINFKMIFDIKQFNYLRTMKYVQISL